MNKTRNLGQRGEHIACAYLRNSSYFICRRNYCSGRHEIDIIAKKPSLLVFVEVKSRSSNAFGFPEEMVSIQQQRSILLAAEAYLFETGWLGRIRFDIISIEWMPRGHRLAHFEDAFY